MTIASAARRGFLKKVAGGAAVLGLGGSNIASEAGRLTGGDIMGYGAYASGMAQAGGSISDGPRLSFMQVWRVIRGGIPDWKRKAIEREARYPNRIDPDIASMRSWSLAQKFRVQHERNVKRMIEDHMNRPLIEHYRREFEREHGVWL